MKALRQSPAAHQPTFALKVLSASLAACFATATVANPALPQIAAGTATFSRQGQSLLINNSDKAIINWGSFSIGAGEITRFVQSGAASSVLNRVTGGEASQILGQLLSNGKVFVINPNGIAIGGGARIDTAGFIASSLGMSDADFLSGKLRFVATGPGATVSNEGVIQGNGALVALIGPRVDSSGTIASAGGTVVLAAGRDVELLDAHSPNIRVKLGAQASSAQLAQVLQRGVLTVALPDANNAVGATVEGGRIVLHSAGDVSVSGTMAAQNPNGNGGRIDVLAQNITVKPSADLDASGQSGGRITVLAQNDAVAAGRYTANASAGAGGFVETSGLRRLDVTDAVVRASGNTPGTWLLDPFDIEVVATGPSNNGGQPTFAPTGNNSRILNTQLNTALDSGLIVVLDTGTPGPEAGNITISAPITSTNNGSVLRLIANNNIAVADNITSAGQVQLRAAGGIVIGRPIIGAAITGRDVNLTATGSAGVQRTGPQANDVIVTGTLGSNNLVVVSSGPVGSALEPLRFSSPVGGASWGINTSTAGATGNIFLRPTVQDFRIDDEVQLRTATGSAQTVSITHTPVGAGSVGIFNDLVSDDNFTLRTPGTLVSSYLNLGGRPSVVAAASIRVDADKFTNPGNVSGAFFDTSAADGTITLSAQNGFNDGNSFGVGVAPGLGTVTARASSNTTANSIRLSHYGSDLVTSRYFLDFTNGAVVGGQTLDLFAETGDLRINGTSGFASTVDRQNVTLRARAAGKALSFDGGTVKGNQTNFFAANGAIDNTALGVLSFDQTESVPGTGGWRLDGLGLGSTNPIGLTGRSPGVIVTNGVSSVGNIRVNFVGPAPSVIGALTTATGTTQQITLTGDTLRLQGSNVIFRTDNDD